MLRPDKTLPDDVLGSEETDQNGRLSGTGMPESCWLRDAGESSGYVPRIRLMIRPLQAVSPREAKDLPADDSLAYLSNPIPSCLHVSSGPDTSA